MVLNPDIERETREGMEMISYFLMIGWIYTETLFSIVSILISFKNMIKNWKKSKNKEHLKKI